ncbi:MAG: hypothetical protein KAR00_03320 [Candidatus Pacebacteria bacterium]|nr:hypothetical protein [Candidatus Paceibacterota bacterium]
MAFLKVFIFFILFIPMMLLVYISSFLHPHMEKLVKKAKTNFLYFPLIVLFIPIFIPVTLVLNQAHDWWEGLGE